MKRRRANKNTAEAASSGTVKPRSADAKANPRKNATARKNTRRNARSSGASDDMSTEEKDNTKDDSTEGGPSDKSTDGSQVTGEPVKEVSIDQNSVDEEAQETVAVPPKNRNRSK